MKKLLLLLAVVSLFACSKEKQEKPKFPFFSGYTPVELHDYLKAGFEPVVPSRIVDFRTYGVMWYNGMQNDAIKANASYYLIYITLSQFEEYKARVKK